MLGAPPLLMTAQTFQRSSEQRSERSPLNKTSTRIDAYEDRTPGGPDARVGNLKLDGRTADPYLLPRASREYILYRHHPVRRRGGVRS